MDLVSDLNPDVVIMDLSMPNTGGIQATQQLKEFYPEVCVLILTIHEDDCLLKEALQCGASGYILKRAVETELTNAIRSVARGDLYIHPAMTRALIENTSADTEVKRPAAVTLTHREVEVLRLIAQGYSNRQIATQLTISVRTVESHRANLMAKLNLHSRVELVRYAAGHGLLEDWEKNLSA
jgi:DNA-binding NarL/FixJ family response regulator